MPTCKAGSCERTLTRSVVTSSWWPVAVSSTPSWSRTCYKLLKTCCRVPPETLPMTLIERLTQDLNTPLGSPEIHVEGRVTRMIGLTLEAVGLRVALGEYCRVQISARQI